MDSKTEKKLNWHEINKKHLKQYRKEYWSRPEIMERRRQQTRERYAKDKTPFYLSNKRRREKLRNRINQIKEATACMDCEKKYPYYVMHFDHRIPAIKICNINNIYTSCTAWVKIQAEIDKCDLVCANCHAVRTYNQNLKGLFQNGET